MSKRSKAQIAREERLRAALRQNLKRRRAQARGRERAEEIESESPRSTASEEREEE